MFGKVEEITLRYTVLRANADMRRFIVPNHILTKYLVKTYNIEELVRYDISFEIQRHVDQKHIEKIIIDAVHTIPWIQEREHTKLLIEEIKTYGQCCRLLCYANPRC